MQAMEAHPISGAERQLEHNREATELQVPHSVVVGAVAITTLAQAALGLLVLS